MRLHIKSTEICGVQWMQKKIKIKKSTLLALDPGVLFMNSPPPYTHTHTHHLLTLSISLLGGLWKPGCAVTE